MVSIESKLWKTFAHELPVTINSHFDKKTTQIHKHTNAHIYTKTKKLSIESKVCFCYGAFDLHYKFTLQQKTHKCIYTETHKYTYTHIYTNTQIHFLWNQKCAFASELPAFAINSHFNSLSNLFLRNAQDKLDSAGLEYWGTLGNTKDTYLIIFS